MIIKYELEKKREGKENESVERKEKKIGSQMRGRGRRKKNGKKKEKKRTQIR